MKNKRLIAIGEALIDFIPDKVGCEFYEVSGFSPKLGGAPANVCGAFARLGGSARLITQLGCDPFGDKIMRELAEYGIDTSCISRTDKANTALAFVSLARDGNRTFSFYRKPSADMLLTSDKIRAEWFEDVFALHFCSVSLGDFPMKSAHYSAIDAARKKGGIISFDPNLRFQLWDDPAILKRTVLEFIPLADILKISDEELEFITGERDHKKGIPKLFNGNVKMIVYTCGGKGAYVFTENNVSVSEATAVDIKDTTGAGDGFIGSFLWMLNELGMTAETLSDMEEREQRKCLDFSNAFCAESVRKYGAIPSYPTLEEIRQKLR
ncbi:MAG: carbohydrate kinase [Oscillospiraceae bacterium]|nr:carbohydrate kinase [Oscillospiraceae bacterium]